MNGEPKGKQDLIFFYRSLEKNLQVLEVKFPKLESLSLQLLHGMFLRVNKIGVVK